MKISDQDLIILNNAKANVELSKMEAEKFLLKQELAMLNLKYVTVQLFRKYGLGDTDSLDAQGNVLSETKEEGKPAT